MAALAPTVRGAGSRAARVLAQWRGSVAGRVAVGALLWRETDSGGEFCRDLPSRAFLASLAVSEDLGLHSALEILGKAREKRHPGIYESAVKGGAWSVGITSEMPKTFQFACHTFESLRRVSNI